MGHIDTNLLFSFILGLMGIVISVVIWAASTHAARVQAREARLSREALIDVDTLNQIKRVYESAIQQLEEEVRRLRVEARTFEEKAINMERELSRLRDRLGQEKSAPEEPSDETVEDA
jgi:phage shock protein A